MSATSAIAGNEQISRVPGEEERMQWGEMRSQKEVTRTHLENR